MLLARFHPTYGAPRAREREPGCAAGVCLSVCLSVRPACRAADAGRGMGTGAPSASRPRAPGPAPIPAHAKPLWPPPGDPSTARGGWGAAVGVLGFWGCVPGIPHRAVPGAEPTATLGPGGALLLGWGARSGEGTSVLLLRSVCSGNGVNQSAFGVNRAGGGTAGEGALLTHWGCGWGRGGVGTLDESLWLMGWR